MAPRSHPCLCDPLYTLHWVWHDWCKGWYRHERILNDKSFHYNLLAAPYHSVGIYSWMYLNYALFLGGMFFAFGSTCAESHWIWYSLSTYFWTILPSRQMAMFWCCQENAGLLKVQFSAGLTVRNLFLCAVLLLNVFQIADFTSPETITVVTSDSCNCFESVTINLLWIECFLIFLRKKSCCFLLSGKFILPLLGLVIGSRQQKYESDIRRKLRNYTGGTEKTCKYFCKCRM